MKQAGRKVEKPWGYELIWAETGSYVGKLLHIKRDQQLSLQYHKVKEETIIVSKGKLKFIFEEQPGSLMEFVLLPGDIHHIPPGKQHRMIALEDTDVYEVSTPHLNDVVRLEDSYGRVS